MTELPEQILRRTARFLVFVAVVAMLAYDAAHAQQNTITGYNQIVGQWDASQAARTNNSRTGTGSPAGRDTCQRPGESYFQTDAVDGRNNWFCTALPGTWTNATSANGLPVLACASTPGPGNTTGAYRQQCQDGNGAVYACNNSGGCSTSGQWVAAAGPVFSWPGAGIMVSTGSGAGTSLTTTSGLEGITFTAGVPSLTALGTAATSNSNVFQPAITGVTNEVFGGTGPGMIALTSSYLPLSAMGNITGGTWNGTAIARAYGGLNSTSAGTGLLRDGTTPTASEISGDCTTSGSNAINCTKTNGASFAPSSTTDTTNAGNISSGTLGYGRLPTPAGGGPAGVVAVLTATNGAISNTATQVIGYRVPSGTFATGTTYTIEAWGLETTSTSPGNDTFSVEIGSVSLSGNVIVQVAPAATASATTKPVYVRATVTIFASTVSGSIAAWSNSGGALNATTSLAISNSATITASQSNVIELVYQSGASTSSITFTAARISLDKP